MKMTPTERKQLDALLAIAEEEPCPLTEWESEFLRNLDDWGSLSPKQADVFDRLVDKHLKGE